MEIRLATEKDYQNMIDFIDKHWKKDHALVKSKELFDWQHKEGEEYNVYIAMDGQLMVGIFCFISLQHYDKTLDQSKKDFTGANWKALEDLGYPGVGMALMKTLWRRKDFNSFGGLGTSETAQKLYTILKMKNYLYNQFYIANNSITDFKVAKNPITSASTGNEFINWNIEISYNLNAINTPEYHYLPKKNKEFFINRFQYHPIYKYIYWVIKNEDDIVNVWIVRRIVVDGHSIFRIVDVMGDLSLLPSLHKQVQKLLQQEHAEYVDFVNYGVDENTFYNIGFQKLDVDSDETIIPSYFEPFERRNIKLGLTFKSPFDYVAFQADGDRDRPSLL